ncbi:MAG TPA: Sua5/YciO/YrdC/YwlC family protein, partial [Bacilli bacterium]|nr:Sua5/YciO/YrdC/YwlC family protein [Bacilli bacterium]
MRISSREFCQMPKENLRGKVVVFPTDTVYGIGALLDDPDGIAKIYRIKHRDEQKPLAILVGEIEAIYPFVREISPEAKRIMEEYWPGELTLIFEKA